MPAGRASTSLVTRSARSATGRMATGTWAQARPSGVCSGSRRRWAISWGSGNKGPWLEVRDRLKRLLLGGSAYFGYGPRLPAYRAVDNHVYDRVRAFLRKRHKVQGRGAKRFSDDQVFGAFGVLRLRRVHLGPPPCASR